MDKKKVIFYGTLPKKGEPPFGGGEVGNLRTVNMLRNNGYDVTTIRQRIAGATWSRPKKLISYPFRLLVGWVETLCTLLFASRKCIVHLSGFAGKTIFNEYVLMHVIKALGYNAIYEIRGGGIFGFWEMGSKRYKKMFSYLVKSACYIFSQGKENIPLLQSIADTSVYHYPNCVEDDFAPLGYIQKSHEIINLLFYGRLEKEKHVDLIIEAASLIQENNPNVYLFIVGNGNSDYVDYIKDCAEKKLKAGSYQIEQGRNHDGLKELLKDKHFYIFPSTQPREGQSNSLTECMSYGVVPVASPQGYNRSTVGDNYLIVDELDARCYADRIIEIINSGKFEELSHQVYERFLQNYTETIVTTKTLEQYKKILESNY